MDLSQPVFDGMLVCQETVERPESAGVALWQYCDTRTFDNTRTLTRPRGFNNKGLFDEYRRPKLAVESVKRILRGNTPDIGNGCVSGADRRHEPILRDTPPACGRPPV